MNPNPYVNLGGSTLKEMNKICVALLALVLACAQPTVSPEVAKWESQAKNITIVRDDFGVPHIYGKTDADAVFGLLYAQCEDDFPRVERNYIWALGRLAEVEGEEQLYSDLRARLFMTKQEAIANYEKSPEWLKTLCQAFADGVNYYLHTHPEVKPALISRFEPWMPMYFSEGSIGGDIERIPTASIASYYGQEKATGLGSLEESLEPQGSNGFAVSGDLTSSGNSMLLINPHTSFYFRGEVHVVSEEGLNAYGAVTWGQFFVYQGFNEKTGWMHTSTYTDVIDEFIETVKSEEGELKYKYGEEWRTVKQLPVTLKYIANGTMQEESFTMLRTHHGPVTGEIDGKPVATALMWDPVNALQQSFIRTKQNGYDGFREMMDIKTNSSNNTVYADADGNIAYFHGNFIPVRDVQFDYANPVDGSNPATDWNGLHDVEESIKLLNPSNGWIQNCNSTPFTAALDNSPNPEDYPYYMATAPENFRGVHAIDLLKEADELTLDELITLAYDPYLPGFEKLIGGLVDAYDQSPIKHVKLIEPINVLRGWDFKVNEASVAMTLAHYYGLYYAANGEMQEGMSYMDRIDSYGTSSDSEERLAFFKTVIENLETDFGTWNLPWGEVNRFQRLDGAVKSRFDDDLPSVPVGLASGRWGALAAYGSRTFEGTKKLYGYRGNSFVAVVEFGEKVKAKSLLAGGQSNNPESPHFDDQIDPYVNVQFKDVAFYKEDIENRAERTYRPGE